MSILRIPLLPLLLLSASFPLGCSRSDGADAGDNRTGLTGVPFRRQILDVGGGVGLEPVDVDGDGDLDLLQTDLLVGPAANAVLINNGNAEFTGYPLPVIEGRTTCHGVGDFDGDGSIDLVAGTWIAWERGGKYLYRNHGRGVFTPTRIPDSGYSPIALATGDVDGDGDLDLVVANSGGPTNPQPSELYLNDGSGRFSFAGILGSATDPTGGLALGDMDGDGNLDVILINNTVSVMVPDRLLLGDGAGRFREAVSAFPARRGRSERLNIADLDGDGDLDVLIANTGRIWLNDGGARFREVAAGPASEGPALLVDVNGDAMLDLVVSTPAPNRGGNRTLVMLYRHSVALGDGRGGFGFPRSRLLPDYHYDPQAGCARAGDLDQDGDLDLVTAGARLRIYRSLVRDVFAADEPRTGGTWRIEIHALSGIAPAGQVALPWLGIAPLAPPKRIDTFGLWGISPVGSIGLPSVPLASPSGLGSFLIRIPPTRALAGSKLYLQALLLHAPERRSWRFTNVLARTIL